MTEEDFDEDDPRLVEGPPDSGRSTVGQLGGFAGIALVGRRLPRTAAVLSARGVWGCSRFRKETAATAPATDAADMARPYS